MNVRVNSLESFHSGLAIINAKRFPIEHVGKSLSPVTLNDSLSPVQLREVEHESAQLIDGLVQSDVHSVDDVDTIGLRVSDALLHEAAKTRQVGRDGGNAHDRTFSGCVTPWFIIAGEHTHVATSHKVLVLETEKGIGGRQKLGMENDFDPVVTIVEQLATSQGAHDGVGGVVYDVVCRDWWKK